MFYLAHEMFHQYQAEHKKHISLLKKEDKNSCSYIKEMQADAFALAYCEMFEFNIPQKICHDLYKDVVTYDENVDSGRVPIEVREIAEKYKKNFWFE